MTSMGFLRMHKEPGEVRDFPRALYRGTLACFRSQGNP